MKIITEVTKLTGISHAEMCTRTRQKEVAYARHLAMYFLAKTDLTLKSIGYKFSRDHATVIHARKRIETELTYNKKVHGDVQELDAAINHKKVVYISGKITGYSLAKYEFALHAARLRNIGFEVVTPFDIVPDGVRSWRRCMVICLAKMAEIAALPNSAVYFLPNWRKSKGAIMERDFAKSLGVEIMEGEV